MQCRPSLVVCGIDAVSKHQCQLCSFQGVGILLFVFSLINSAHSCNHHQSGGPIFGLDMRIGGSAQQDAHEISVGGRGR